MEVKYASPFWARIYIAGDLEQAKQACREWCMEAGGCVTVEPVSYIYTGGEEAGIVVGFIDYARFPASPEKIKAKAEDLADRLMMRMCQHSYSITTPDGSSWYSRRPT
ncbi:hypothetical protein [Bradyrhizobium sp. USDA 329]|uniref:hypothetical protein n=1 Tax=unclassified Bradyrhizobium TaxID=2631580 RepID=UPI0035155F4F